MIPELLIPAIVLLFVFVLGAVWWSRRVDADVRRVLRNAATPAHRFIEAPPPAPFDRLSVDPQATRIPQLQLEHQGQPLTLWIEPDRRWADYAVIVVATVPHERAYRDTTLLMSTDWEPAGDSRTMVQTADLIGRLHLEGRSLSTGLVWQGFQLQSTNPTVVEANLPDDLPRTEADRAYEDLTRVLLLYRHTILFFRPTRDPQRLRDYLTFTADFATAINAFLGPLPDPFIHREMTTPPEFPEASPTAEM